MEITGKFGELRSNFVGAVKDLVGQAKQILLFITLFPDWQTHHKLATKKLETVKRKIDVLKSLEDDIREELRLEEYQAKRKRRKEVATWLKKIAQTKTDVRMLEKKVVEKETYFGILVESSIEETLRELEELREQSEFPDGLTFPDEPLLEPESIGRQRYVDTIIEWLNDSSVSRVGVYGVKGVGKTEILKYIHDKLSQCTMFDHVYWVSVPELPSISKLQEVIAKQVRVDLSVDEDKVMRAAKLLKYLTKRGKCVIILDGVSKKSVIEELGIRPCKLVVSSLSLEDCLKMDCRPNLEIETLSEEAAMKMFKKNLALRTPLEQDMEEVSVDIVKECQGLPLCIRNVAVELRGVDDINEWRDVLVKMKANRKGHEG